MLSDIIKRLIGGARMADLTPQERETYRASRRAKTREKAAQHQQTRKQVQWRGLGAARGVVVKARSRNEAVRRVLTEMIHKHGKDAAAKWHHDGHKVERVE